MPSCSRRSGGSGSRIKQFFMDMLLDMSVIDNLSLLSITYVTFWQRGRSQCRAAREDRGDRQASSALWLGDNLPEASPGRRDRQPQASRTPVRQGRAAGKAKSEKEDSGERTIAAAAANSP